MELKERMDKQYSDIKMSIIICIIIIFIASIVNFIDIANISRRIQIILNCITCIFCIISFPMIPHLDAYIKLRKDPEYIKLITGKCEKAFENLYGFEVYFTDKSVIDITNLLYGYFGKPFTKVNYKDMAIIDNKRIINRNFNAYYIFLIDKKLKKINIANATYLSEERSIMFIEEIKKKVPNVLVGYNKENMYRAKLMMNN